MNYSTTTFSCPKGGAFSAISCPTWWGICHFLLAVKTNPHLYPGVGWVGVYFDWHKWKVLQLISNSLSWLTTVLMEYKTTTLNSFEKGSKLFSPSLFTVCLSLLCINQFQRCPALLPPGNATVGHFLTLSVPLQLCPMLQTCPHVCHAGQKSNATFISLVFSRHFGFAGRIGARMWECRWGYWISTLAAKIRLHCRLNSVLQELLHRLKVTR